MIDRLSDRRKKHKTFDKWGNRDSTHFYRTNCVIGYLCLSAAIVKGTELRTVTSIVEVSSSINFKQIQRKCNFPMNPQVRPTCG